MRAPYEGHKCKKDSTHKRKGNTTDKGSNLLHFMRGTAPATTYLKKTTHAWEQKKEQYDQQREQNQKSFP